MSENYELTDLGATEYGALVRDARRYRWLLSEHYRIDPVCHVVWKKNYDRGCGDWANTSALDREIDAAMEAANE